MKSNAPAISASGAALAQAEKQLGGDRLQDLTLASVQQFLERQGGSRAVNPTAALYTPKTARRSESQAMSAGQVELALEAVEFREQVILWLTIFGRMRPGELLAIQREQVRADASSALEWSISK